MTNARATCYESIEQKRTGSLKIIWTLWNNSGLSCIWHLPIYFPTRLVVHRSTLSVYNSLGGFKGLSIKSYLGVGLFIVKGFKVKLAKGKDTWGKVRGKPRQASKDPLLWSYRDVLNLSSDERDNTCKMLSTGKFNRDPRILTGY